MPVKKGSKRGWWELEQGVKMLESGVEIEAPKILPSIGRRKKWQ